MCAVRVTFLLQFFLAQMSSLSIASSAVDIISVYLKVAMHQGSVLSPLLFAVAMDVVPSEARSGIPSELLYAVGIVLMAPIMEPLGIRVTE